MSRSKDRARAESGLIFRDGSLHKKEDWYAAHPTREMRAERQAGVDKAVADLMAEKVEKASTESKFSYYCSKCNHRHTEGSQICMKHREFARTPVTLRKEA